jgi:hypothetical protein
MKDYILGLPKVLDDIRNEIRSLSQAVNELQQSDTQRLKERVANLEIAKDDGGWKSRRDLEAGLKKWSLNTFVRAPQHPDEAGELGGSLPSGGSPAPPQLKLDATQDGERGHKP